MKLIVGLGNPGKNYAGTKHNVGFEVIDLVAKEIGTNVNKVKHKAMVGDGFINGEKVIFIKPQTFMNLSGESVKEATVFYKIPIEDIVIVYDDTSLPVGATRIREKGSAGGHNGMKNIIAHLGTDNFTRIRVGIGAKPNGWDLADYVLSRFDKDDEPLILAGYERAAKAVEILVKEGTQAAMNKTNVTAKGDAKKE